MIVYSSNKQVFIDDVRSNSIEDIINNEVYRKLNKNSARSEILSWKNSLQYMLNILIDPDIPSSAGISIEYNIPLTNRRVDFILTGKNAERKEVAVIIELKQWQEAEVTTKDGIVSTRFKSGQQETSHPSYQAWSYSSLIEDYNETVRNECISLQPCAYLHNMKSRHAINDDFYKFYTDHAPVFISEDALKLADFLKQYVKYGDSDDIMYRIEHGKIKPSKNLADSLAAMLDGKPEFLMLDEQKLVYETALDLAHKAQNGQKQTFIVNGGPGTGKSVVAIQLLSEMTKRELVVQYSTKNAAPRDVFKKMLKGSRKKIHIDNMFKPSGSYTATEENLFDTLLVDEAHRLNAKSGLYSHLGENQIKELIHSSKCSIFFIDEAQRVTLQDIGSVESIYEWAEQLGSSVTEMDLVSQFRCNGSDGYLSWLNNTLQISDTANPTLEDVDYDVKIFDDPNEMRRAIFEKNRLTNKARMVAGYCWDWISDSRKKKNDPDAMDITIPEHNFEAQWNLARDGNLWLIEEKSVEQIGCIHTCQGLELDYVGVIIGPDFLIREQAAVTDALQRSNMDKSVRGIKKMLKNDPEAAKKRAEEIIKNTYRTLMSRGQKGCYIYCVDKETSEHFTQAAQTSTQLADSSSTGSIYDTLDFPISDFESITPYDGYVPIYPLEAAAGGFSEAQNIEEYQWVKLPEYIKASKDMFVVRVVGESMNRKIPNGSWCLFKANPAGTRNGKIVLVQHREIEDPDHGGSYTVKLYESVKFQEDALVNQQITLKPHTTSYGYQPIILEGAGEDLLVAGEFLMVL